MRSLSGGSRVALFERVVRRLNLRFPVMFGLFGLLTLMDLAVPDFIPFVDELGLAFLTLLFGLWRDRLAATTGEVSIRPGVELVK